LLLPCEESVRFILPAVKRGIVRVLHEKFHLKQAEIANLLKISQPSVSHFLKGIRGTALDVLSIDPEIKEAVETFSSDLVNKNLSDLEIYQGICSICSLIRQKGYVPGVSPNYDITSSKTWDKVLLECEKVAQRTETKLVAD